MKKFYYLFIGDSERQIDKKQIRFVVESETAWQADTNCTGRVVAVNKEAKVRLGEMKHCANPIFDMQRGFFPSYISVGADHLCRMDERAE